MLRQTIAYYTKPFKSALKLALPVFLLFCTSSTIAHNWRELAPGVEYIDLSEKLLTPWSHVHVFRISLKKNQMDIVLANVLSQQQASVDEIAHFSKALITINGGFFDHNYQPLGLRVSHQHQHSPLKRISWWGIFYIENQKPYLSNVQQFQNTKQLDFAIQSGPRLLINGHIPHLKAGRDERSALGISNDDQVIILITDNAPLTTTAVAKLMKSPPLNCKEALNLDGGSSSQISANVGPFKLNVHGFSNISDAIIVKPRT